MLLNIIGVKKHCKREGKWNECRGVIPTESSSSNQKVSEIDMLYCLIYCYYSETGDCFFYYVEIEKWTEFKW